MSFVSTKEAGCQPTKRSNESEQDDEPHAKSARVSRIPVLDRKSDAASTPLPPKPSDGRLAWMPMQLKDGKAPRMPTSKIPIYMRKKRALSAPPSPKAASDTGRVALQAGTSRIPVLVHKGIREGLKTENYPGSPSTFAETTAFFTTNRFHRQQSRLPRPTSKAQQKESENESEV